MDTSRQQIDLDSVLQELRILYHRATIASPSDVDLLAIDLFASVVQQYESTIYEATKIIAEKFKSTNPDEVLLALNVLEECMSKCGPKFHSEIGKFRFLNELIRLVSPVYQGDKTPKKIRDKILDLMLLWTVNYPQESKIKEAYEMLLKRGVRHEFVKTVQIQNKNEATKSTAQPDLSDKLKKLLQSTNPSDHKAANLLIQNMVKEKERRTEVQARRKLQLKEVYENAYLLNEMLDQTGSANGAEVLTEDVLVTLNDLYEACRQLQPTILILVGDLNETDLLEEALEANDLLTEVLAKYSKIILKHTPTAGTYVSSSNLIASVGENSTAPQTMQNAMDELSEIFSAQPTEGSRTMTPTTSLNMNLLEPTLALGSPVSSDAARDAIKELNQLSATTMPSSSAFDHLNGFRSVSSTPQLPTLVPVTSTTDNGTKSQSRLVNFDTEITELVSGLKLNMGKNSVDNFVADADLDDEKLLEAVPDDVEPLKATNCEIDLLAYDFDPLVPPGQTNKSKPSPENESSVKNSQENVNKPLSEIFIDLNSIRPHDEYQSRCILDESNGLKILLNFTKDHPRPDVSVLVITTTNHNNLPLSQYQFEASVTKPCKIHLQKASGHKLAAVKPFRPPSEDITQVLLLSNPERIATKIMCIISYVLGDDPDPVKEFVEINDLPVLF